MTTPFIEVDIFVQTEIYQWHSSLQSYTYYPNWLEIRKAMDR